jgi:transposase
VWIDLPGVREIIDQLKRQNATLVALLESRDKELQRRDNEIAALKQQLAWLKDKVFGRSSEKINHPDLFTVEESKKPEASPESTSGPEAAGEAKAEPRAKKSRPIRKAKLPEGLPVVMGREVLPPEVLFNPGGYTRVGERLVDRVERDPGYYYLLRDVYPIFAPKDAPQLPPIQAPALPSLVPGSFWGPSLMADVLVNKYAYAQPYDRQHRLNLSQFGVDLPVSTMCDVQKNVTAELEILVRMMEDQALGDTCLSTDDTFHRYLDRVSPKGSLTGFFRVVRRSNSDVIFRWEEQGKGEEFEKWLARAAMKVFQSDGHGRYPPMINRLRALGKEIEHAACMAHIRRKFVHAEKEHPWLVKWFLRQIRRLYEIEKELWHPEVGPEIRARVRTLRSAPILNLIKKAMLHLRRKCPKILPKSMLGKALNHALGQWDGMQVYLRHGEVFIDNNHTERDIRQSAVGKKNYLFIGHPEAGKGAAVMYTLLGSARNHGLDPKAYLKDVIERLPLLKANDKAGLAALLPANWAVEFKNRQAASQVPPATNAA